MTQVVRMPKLGLEMAEGTVLDWKVAEEDAVEAGDVLLEIESEKSVADVEAREGGVLVERLLEEGETVEPGTPLGIVAPADADVESLVEEVEAEIEGGQRATAGDESDDAPPDGADEPSTASADAPEPAKVTPRARARAEDLGVDLDGIEGTGYDGAISAVDVEARAAETTGRAGAEGDEGEGDEPGADDHAAKVTPRASELARELDVDPETIEGSGFDGAVTAEDVEAAVEASTADADVERSPADGGKRSSLTVADASELGSTRRTIARRLGESDREAVHVTIHRSAAVGALESIVEGYHAGKSDADPSLVDLLIAALSDALEAHPAFNARFEDGVHRSYEEHDVAVAVDAESGLVAPTLGDVRGRSIEEIATERGRLTERALDGSSTPDDLAGGTFTVTNLGPMGVEWFDPVIDPPQVAILGVGAIVERAAAADDGGVELRRELPLSLSFDHRVVDGADAARFLGTLVDRLEHPADISAVDADVVRFGGEFGGDFAGESDVDSGGESGVDSGGDSDVDGRRATARNDAGMSGTAVTGGVEVPFDEPEDLGGEGSAPSPVALLLASLASCLSLSVRFQAEKHSLDLGSVEVDVEATPGRGSIESIAARLAIETSAPEDVVDRLVATAERGCHVSAAIDPDVPVGVEWERTR